ncbi:MAG: ankyrin repeat domain-containing protein [Deltaproteobacteria bacterium]|nr:ankyrin repeat domain-containing protein [Deltaproteobacteria bacterium]
MSISRTTQALFSITIGTIALIAIITSGFMAAFADELTDPQKKALAKIEKEITEGELISGLGAPDFSTREKATDQIYHLLPTGDLRLTAEVAKILDKEREGTTDPEICLRLSFLIDDVIGTRVSKAFLADMKEWDRWSLPGMADDIEQKWFSDTFGWLVKVNVRDEGGITPLMLATQNLDLAMIQMLLSKGANPSRKDFENKSADSYARPIAGVRLKKFNDTHMGGYVNEKAEQLSQTRSGVADTHSEGIRIEHLRNALAVLRLLKKTEPSTTRDNLERALENTILQHDFPEKHREARQQRLEELLKQIDELSKSDN